MSGLGGEIVALLFSEVIQGLIDQKPSDGGQSMLGPGVIVPGKGAEIIAARDDGCRAWRPLFNCNSSMVQVGSRRAKGPGC